MALCNSRYHRDVVSDDGLISRTAAAQERSSPRKGAHKGGAHGAVPSPPPIRLGAHWRKGPKYGKMQSKSPSRVSLAVLMVILWLI